MARTEGADRGWASDLMREHLEQPRTWSPLGTPALVSTNVAEREGFGGKR